MEVMLSEYIRILFTVYSVLKQHLELLIGRKEEALQSNVIQIEKEREKTSRRKIHQFPQFVT